MRMRQIIEARKKSKAKPDIVASMKSGLLGCSRACSRRASSMVLGRGVREEWS